MVRDAMVRDAMGRTREASGWRNHPGALVSKPVDRAGYLVSRHPSLVTQI